MFTNYKRPWTMTIHFILNIQIQNNVLFYMENPASVMLYNIADYKHVLSVKGIRIVLEQIS